MFGKRKVAALVSEFLGAGVLTFLILSVQRSSIGVPFFVATAAGLSLAMLTFALGGVSTGYFNPAITIGLWTARRIATVSAVLYVAAQLLGGWLSYMLYTYFVNNSLQRVGGHYTTHILVAEAVGTAVFAFGLTAAVYQRLSPAVTASFAGLSYMLGIITASSASIGLLNPAVALGVRAWVWGTYVVGPVIGAVVGVYLYDSLFAAEATGLVAAATTGRTVTGGRPSAKKKSLRKK